MTGRLSKAGFEDKEIEIKSHFTNDSWSTGGGLFDSDSAWSLLPPGRTIGGIGVGAISPAMSVAMGENPLFLLATPFTIVAGFVYGLGLDIYNLFYGLPSVIIKNPWYEYDGELDFTKELLIPTTEFIKNCHSKKNTFIGNNSCLSCLIGKEVMSTEEECNRCSNRWWSDSECYLK